MGEWYHFRMLLKSSRMDVIVPLTTFVLTVLFDLIIAIEVGMILSSFIFMKRMSESTSIQEAMDYFKSGDENGEKLFEEEIPDIPKGALIYEINGPLFFGASQKFQEVMKNLKQRPEILILRVRNVPFIDATGINRLIEIYKNLQAHGTKVLISGANGDVKRELLKMGVYKDLNKYNICNNINEAIRQAKKILEAKNEKHKS